VVVVVCCPHTNMTSRPEMQQQQQRDQRKQRTYVTLAGLLALDELQEDALANVAPSRESALVCRRVKVRMRPRWPCVCSHYAST
jgi:hypothetical protein